MRRLFVITLVALLLGVGVVAIIETDPGYVLISYSHYTLETSLWVGLLLLLLLVFTLFWTARLVYRVLSGQRTFLSWWGNRKSQVAQRHSTRGVILYTEGNLDRARRQLERGLVKNESPLVNYLYSARAADQLGQPVQALDNLRLAGESEPAAKVAVEITLAEMRLRAGEYGQAIAALKTGRLNVGRHPRVLDLLREAYAGLGDWDAMLELLPELKKHKRLQVEEYEALEREVHQHRFALAAKSSADDVASMWQQLPGRLRGDAALMRAHVAALAQAGDHAAAEKAVMRALKNEWDPALVRQLGLLDTIDDDGSKRLSQAERWLADHGQDHELLVCLGRLSARDKLWGKSRDYFEQAYRLSSTPEVCAELGRLLTALGEPKVAAAYYREGLQQREAGLPELPMPDKLVSDGLLAARS